MRIMSGAARALSRRVSGVPLAVRLVVVGAGVLACLFAVALQSARAVTRLLVADPDTIAGDAPLYRRAVMEGHGVFAAHCSGCHGAAGKGDASRGAPDLTDRDWLFGTGSVGEIERIVDYGVRSGDPRGWNLADMPGFARPAPYRREPTLKPLTPDAVQDVVEFLAKAGGRTADPASAVRGSAVYAGAGECYDCHGSDARGDPAIGAPNLVDRVWLYGAGRREDVARSISAGRAGVCPAWINRLSAARIRAVSTYVHAMSNPVPGAAGTG